MSSWQNYCVPLKLKDAGLKEQVVILREAIKQAFNPAGCGCVEGSFICMAHRLLEWVARDEQ